MMMIACKNYFEVFQDLLSYVLPLYSIMANRFDVRDQYRNYVPEYLPFFFPPDFNVFSFLRTQFRGVFLGRSDLKFFHVYYSLIAISFLPFKAQKYCFILFIYFFPNSCKILFFFFRFFGKK